jgi:hydrogenase-4 component B
MLNGGARLTAQQQPTLVDAGAGGGCQKHLQRLAGVAVHGAFGNRRRFLIHRFASAAARRGPAWDCGFPDASPVTQYTAGSFAQPIRRVFGSVVFQARERVFMPPPGDSRRRGWKSNCATRSGTYGYAPIVAAVVALSSRFNAFQYLTIRRYLSLVFGALVLLLLGMVLWR